MRTPFSKTIAAFAIAATTTACGGADPVQPGSTPKDSASTVAAPTPAPAPAPAPAPSPSPDKDLASFAAAWTSFILVQSVQPLQMTAGATGSCGLSGSASYDATASKQTLRGCRLKQFPTHVFEGSFTVGTLTADDTRSHIVASIDKPAVTIMDAATGAAEFTLTAGDIASDMLDSDAGNHYFYASRSLTFRAGQASQYTVSNAGSTSTDILFEAGIPVRYTNNLVYTTSDGKQTWQVTASSTVRENGENRPDRGSLLITRAGGTTALNVAFGPSNSLTLTGGEQGGTRTMNWNDAALQAALTASHQ